jgi:endonuclease/exonuclease/phosphatase family metal-dependent hydrolase
VDRDQPRSGGSDLTRVAADAMGAVDAVFGPALSGLPGCWRLASGTEGVGAPQYGVALLSRYAVEHVRVLRLPVLRAAVPVLFPGRSRPVIVRDEPRIALVATLRTPSGPLTAVSTHLSFIPGWNVVQLRRLITMVSAAPELVVMGDLNMGPRRAARVSRLSALVTGATYPAPAPREQLDHLLGRGLAPVTAGGPRWLAVSDHRALTADVGHRRLA